MAWAVVANVSEDVNRSGEPGKGEGVVSAVDNCLHHQDGDTAKDHFSLEVGTGAFKIAVLGEMLFNLNLDVHQVAYSMGVGTVHGWLTFNNC